MTRLVLGLVLGLASCTVNNDDSGCPAIVSSADEVTLRAAAPTPIELTGCGLVVRIECSPNVDASFSGTDLSAGVDVLLAAIGAGAGACAVEAQSGITTTIAVIVTTTGE